MKYLCVAEKPSIAKSITQILSGGQYSTRNSSVPWIKNFDFHYRVKPSQGDVVFTVTAVAGHLKEVDFASDFKKWSSCDPFSLFDAPIETRVGQDANHRGIAKNLKDEARKATHLMIWTDCDREGEHIGSEVAEVCRSARPNIIVERARFSAIIANQIHNACRNPVKLDMAQANAVSARIELDLRIGAILTRTQTLGLQGAFTELADKVISYGPCQFPTLGFVVDQYERVRNFISEPFWYLHLTLQRDDTEITFSWARGRLFEREAVQTLLRLCEAEDEATVRKYQTKPTQKWKPLPLTTVELQKAGSRLLRLTPKRVLDIAESLYQKGFLSYPRTETDQYDKDFDFQSLVEKQTTDSEWGQFAQELKNGKFERPRNGQKNDKAHPPIHPTAHVSNLSGDDHRVYEFVVRRFLASCSTNAKGLQTTVEVELADEVFSATGLTITERNYLDVYKYDKWSGTILPQFTEGETFAPTTLSMKEGKTSKPSLLTEADLVTLMDKNGIGTDATIAEHIAKIIEREYVFKTREGSTEVLVPSTLGVGLVKGYDEIGLERSLSKPFLRQQTETRMSQICDGAKTRHEVVDESLEEYREMYIKTKQAFSTLSSSVGRYLNGTGSSGSGGGGAGGPSNNGSDGDDSDGGTGGGGGGGGAVTRGGRGGSRGGASTRARGSSSRGASTRGAATRGRGATTAGRPRKQSVSDDDGGDGPSYGGGGGGAKASTSAAGAAQQCKCGEDAVERTVAKEGPNKGRKFWTCGKGRDDGCGFFEWTDEATGSAGSGRGSKASSSRSKSAGSVVPAKRPFSTSATANSALGTSGDDFRCKCDLTPAFRTVNNQGANQGRNYYTCPSLSSSAKCNFFVWESELDGEAPAAKRTMSAHNGGGGQSAYSCYKCGEQGHFSSACPQNDPGATSRGGGGAGASGACYKCGEPGHFSNACPNNGAASTSRGSGGGASAGSCYKCGEPGHFSNACTNGDARGGGGGSRAGGGGSGTSGSCFKCGEAGHFSSACPNGDSRSGSRSGGGGTTTGSCYKCGEPGHFSSACPNGDSRGGGGGGATSGSCYKCGEPGHFSNACPNGDAAAGSRASHRGGSSTDMCYKCQQPGHWASACPNEQAGSYRGGDGSASRGGGSGRARGRARGGGRQRGGWG